MLVNVEASVRDEARTRMGSQPPRAAAPATGATATGTTFQSFLPLPFQSFLPLPLPFPLSLPLHFQSLFLPVPFHQSPFHSLSLPLPLPFHLFEFQTFHGVWSQGSLLYWF
jgi:hypothetical protein